jgi:hypothetical protein
VPTGLHLAGIFYVGSWGWEYNHWIIFFKKMDI